MPYNETLAERVRKLLQGKGEISEKKMFGGLCFLLRGKMCCGILKDDLVARVDPKESDSFLKKGLVRPMDFTGRPMKGFLYVSPKALEGRSQLEPWVKRCLVFAESLPAKKKKP